MAISWHLNRQINPSILYPLFNTPRSGSSPNASDISQHLDSNRESAADISLDLWKFVSCFHNFPSDISLDLWWKSMCSFHDFPADISLDLWKFVFFSLLIYHAKGSSNISLSIWPNLSWFFHWYITMNSHAFLNRLLLFWLWAFDKNPNASYLLYPLDGHAFRNLLQMLRCAQLVLTWESYWPGLTIERNFHAFNVHCGWQSPSN